MKIRQERTGEYESPGAIVVRQHTTHQCLGDPEILKSHAKKLGGDPIELLPLTGFEVSNCLVTAYMYFFYVFSCMRLDISRKRRYIECEKTTDV